MNAAETEQSTLAGDEILRRRFGTPDIPTESSLSEDVVRYIESLDFFFIATCNRTGECDSSYRGKGKGVPAVKVLDSSTIIFPHYMGNGTFRSLGNIIENPHIGMLFMNLQTGRRMRINGQAEVTDNPEWLQWFPNSVLTVKVTVLEAYEQNHPVRASKR